MVLLEVHNKEKKAFLEKYLRRVIPANITLEIPLNRNTHGKLKPFTHGQMKEWGWKYGGV